MEAVVGVSGAGARIKVHNATDRWGRYVTGQDVQKRISVFRKWFLDCSKCNLHSCILCIPVQSKYIQGYPFCQLGGVVDKVVDV